MATADPSIIMGFRPIEIPDQTNLLMKALQIQGAQGQNRLQQLQVQDAESSATQKNALMQLVAGPGFADLDPSTQRSSVLQAAPIVGQGYLKSTTDARAAQANLDKLQSEIDAHHVSRLASDVGAAAQSGPQAVAQAIQGAGYLPADRKAAMLDAMQAGGPDGYGNFIKRIQMSGLTAEQQLAQNNPTILPTDQGLAAVRKDGSGGFMVPNVTGAASYANGTPGVGPGIPGGSPQTPQTINQPYVGQQPAGAFVGDPASLYAGLQRITDPAVRAQAVRALQNQLAGANPTPGADGVFQGGGATGPVRIGGLTQPAPGGGVAPPTTLGGKPQGKWEHDPLNGNFVYLPNNATPGATAGSGGDAMISKAAIDNAAARYNLDGTLPPMGMGAAGAQGRRQILDRAAELATGTNGTDQRIAQMDAKGTASALASLTKQQAAISAFEKTANSNAQLALDMSNKLDRTGIPILNAGLQFGRTNTGSPEAAQFHAAVATFVGEYAKVMSGGSGGGPTSDAARAKASSLLTESMSQQQFASVVKTLQTEMENRMTGFNQQADELRNRLRGQNVSTNGAAPAVTASPSGWAIEKVN